MAVVGLDRLLAAHPVDKGHDQLAAHGAAHGIRVTPVTIVADHQPKVIGITPSMGDREGLCPPFINDHHSKPYDDHEHGTRRAGTRTTSSVRVDNQTRSMTDPSSTPATCRNKQAFNDWPFSGPGDRIAEYRAFIALQCLPLMPAICAMMTESVRCSVPAFGGSGSG